MTRRRTPLPLAVLLSLALVACSGGASRPRDPGESTGALTGTIRLQASGGEGEIKAIEELADAFERAYPGTTVELVPVAQAEEHVAKLTAAFAAGRPPDVFLLNYRRLGTFARRGVLDPPRDFDASGYYEATVRAFTFNGTLTCLPQNASNMVVYWNPKLFQQAGVAPPTADWTWTDLTEKARQLWLRKVRAIAFEPALIRVAPFVWSNGGEVVDDPDNATKVTLGDGRAREALKFLMPLQDYGVGATERAAQDPEEMFASGRVAMYLDSRRAVPGFRKTEGLDFDVAPVPRKQSSVTVLHSDGYCVPKQSENRALAHAFAKFAVGREGGVVLARTGRTVPSLKELATGPDFLDPTKPPKSTHVFVDQLATARALPSVAGWNEAEARADELLEQLFARRIDIEDAVRRIEEDTARRIAAAS